MYLLKKMGWLLLELIVFTFSFLLILLLQFYIFRFLKSDINFWDVSDLNENSSPFRLILSFIPVFIAFLVAAVFTYLLFKRPFQDLGLSRDVNSFSLFGQGVLYSAMIIVPGFLLLLLAGQLKFLSFSNNLVWIVGFFIFFFIQSSAEEIMTRSYLIPTIENQFGTRIAIFLSASLFGLMHIGNDNFTWVGLLNIVLGGSIMSWLFVRFRNIWICAGYHTGWNFIQGSFFDFNVSGVDVYSWIQQQDIGYSRLTGSNFGYEGSLIGILLQSFFLIYLIKKFPIETKPLIWKQPIVETFTIEEPGLESHGANTVN